MHECGSRVSEGSVEQSKLAQVKQKIDTSVCPLHPWFTSRSDHDQDIRCGHSPVSSLHESIHVENLPFWLPGDPQMCMLKGLLCLISWGISPADKLWPCHDKISLLPVIFFRLLLPFQLSSFAPRLPCIYLLHFGKWAQASPLPPSSYDAPLAAGFRMRAVCGKFSARSSECHREAWWMEAITNTGPLLTRVRDSQTKYKTR